jgi:hypothetical protein
VNIQRILSGGQTGVDRAALDFAIARQIPHGGWCPAGRRAADGVLDARYQLMETESSGYRQRTKRNVLDADATLIIYRDQARRRQPAHSRSGDGTRQAAAAVRFACPYRRAVGGMARLVG